MRRLPRDQGDRLDRRRAGPDHADPQAGEIDPLVRPAAGVVRGPAEIIEPIEVRQVGRGQAAGRHDAPGGCGPGAIVGLDHPATLWLVERCGPHAGIEPDVPAQIEPIGDVVGVAQNLRLGGVPLGPVPFLLELVRELVGILHALDVAARARVAVPVPGAADAAAGLEHARRQADRPRPVQHVHPGEPGADDHQVQIAISHGVGCLRSDQTRCSLARSRPLPPCRPKRSGNGRVRRTGPYPRPEAIARPRPR